MCVLKHVISQCVNRTVAKKKKVAVINPGAGNTLRSRQEKIISIAFIDKQNNVNYRTSDLKKQEDNKKKKIA